MSDSAPAPPQGPGPGRVWLRRLIGVAAMASALWSISITLRGPSDLRVFTPPPAATFGVDDDAGFHHLAAVAHQEVFLLERRAAPDHRIFAYDPANGFERTLLRLGDREEVNGLALHPDRSVLAVLHSSDVDLGGVGVSMMDTSSGSMTVIVDTVADVYHLDPVWGPDGDWLYLTRVTLVDGGPQWSIVRVDPGSAVVEVIAVDAQVAAISTDGLWFLAPDVDGNGRRVVQLHEDGRREIVGFADEPMTIDHLMFVPASPGVSSALRFAGHQQEGGTFRIGAPASAHVGPSRWWLFDVEDSFADLEGWPGDTVFDAVTTQTGALVTITPQGVWFSDGVHVQVAQSRAIRFVAG